MFLLMILVIPNRLGTYCVNLEVESSISELVCKTQPCWWLTSHNTKILAKDTCKRYCSWLELTILAICRTYVHYVMGQQHVEKYWNTHMLWLTCDNSQFHTNHANWRSPRNYKTITLIYYLVKIIINWCVSHQLSQVIRPHTQ